MYILTKEVYYSKKPLVYENSFRIDHLWFFFDAQDWEKKFCIYEYWMHLLDWSGLSKLEGFEVYNTVVV